MFLKRIEMQGFKSFADRTVIHFEDEITGIVGPNGCGKSNISDAIRWVLGEQSAKSLRGKNMTDIIFNGSKERRPVNFAEVLLVFDNSAHFLQSEYNEIEVCRRLHRISGESEYLLNRQPCRLKDIVDLVLDSGLSKDSLSIISQGTISNFADAKPEDRRGLFEEAAGVAKYKKRKHESTLKLQRTQDNLERLQDIVDELEKQVGPLKRQAHKATIYKQKKRELEEIEIAVLVSEIQTCQKQMEDTHNELQLIEADVLTHTVQIQNIETITGSLKEENRGLDRNINDLQEEILQVVNQISQWETRKVELDQKRRYAIEHGQDEAKREQLKALVEETRIEYEDRLHRLEALQAELQLQTKQYEQISSSLSECVKNLDACNQLVRQLENRRDVLKAQLQSPFQHQAGVQAVMAARNSLPGIMDVVAKAFKPQEGFELAISTALGGAMYNIITQDEQSARRAIQFLKRNQSGRATFLPLNVMRARYVPNDAKVICEHTEGFLGTADQFVACDKVYDNLVLNLLGNVLITDRLDHANELARLLKHGYNIVTLDGDVVHRGGSMTGGKQSNNYSPMTLQREHDKVVSRLDEAKIKQQQVRVDHDSLTRQQYHLNQALVSTRIQIAQIEPVLNAKQAKYEKTKLEYEELNPRNEEETAFQFENELVTNLNKAYARRDEITTTIRLQRDQRSKNNAEIERKENQIRQIRRQLSQVQDAKNDLEKDKVRAQSQMEGHLLRLNSEYQMTIDFAKKQEFDIDIENAKEKVKQLRADIVDLGNVNMEAPEQFDEVNSRYETLTTQREELISAKNKILNAIAEMDTVMETQFMDTFKRINHELQGTFAVLFGGGRAKLFLENPDDILNSGIEIDVQPPGKNVQNIRLFSGGEKSLIAICVLFAILKARPLPLCIFDEVEAALDPGNVERFASYITQFTDTSQFIVVTHRQGTMEHCDVLYGVTMPQQGVSQILKVRLSEAIDYVEEKEKEE